MSCTSPRYAINHGLKANGKMDLHILPRATCEDYATLCDKFGQENVVQLPCGKCPDCIERRTRIWAARCVLEGSYYENNSFITLTYADKCLPKGGLCKKDVQKFIKRLRKHVGHRISYYAIGEYGPHNTHRPHYHIIIFNWFPSDAKFFTEGDFGGYLWTSNELRDLWPFGHSLIGDVTYASCSYVARYCQKKYALPGEKQEFCLMSTRPAIGSRYFNEHFSEIYDTDKIYFNFGSSSSVSSIAYFDKLLEKIDPDKLESIKNVRVDNAHTSLASDMLSHGFDMVEQLYKYKEEYKASKMQHLKRRI